MADLEADADDPNDVRWEEEDVEELDKLETDGANAAAGLPSTNEDDERLASSTSRLLSIRNGADEPSPETQPEAQSSPGTSADQPTLLRRRNFANSTPFSLGPNFQQSAAPQNFVRPITPTRSLLHDEDLTPNNETATIPLLTPNVSEMLGDGPMTPTNNAGPFVFDGSAGRAAGRSLAAALPQYTERSA